MQLQENKQLQKALKEYKIVIQALRLVNNDSQYIFEELYLKNKSKWQVIDGLHTSEETYKRRNRKAGRLYRTE